eukprot:5970955-Pyramimonas_sp.AAC.1
MSPRSKPGARARGFWPGKRPLRTDMRSTTFPILLEGESAPHRAQAGSAEQIDQPEVGKSSPPPSSRAS